MSKQQEWISHENYVLKDALSLMNCFLLENGSWLDDLYLSALCSHATLTIENSIRSETLVWLNATITAASEKSTRELLKDKYLILGIFLGTNTILKKSPDFLQGVKPLLVKLIEALKQLDWNNDPEFPATILYALTETDLNLNQAKKYLLKNTELFWKQGRRSSAIYSFLGLLQFKEGQVEIAKLLRSISLFENQEKALSDLDLKSIAILLLTVSEIEEKYQYVLYEALEQNLRSEFFKIRDTLLSVLFHQLDKAIDHEKSILTGKNAAMDSLRYNSQTPDTVSVELPSEVARKLFERPHLSSIAISIMAIKRAAFETLYSFEKKTFERKCRPALKPSEYIKVKRIHLLGFLVYTGLGIFSLSALAQVLSNNLGASILTGFFASLFSYGFARHYFSQLVSDKLQPVIEKEESQ
jgi:hypothetical protein